MMFAFNLLTIATVVSLLFMVKVAECRVLYTEVPPVQVTDAPDPYVNQFNRTLLVIAAPSVWDFYYRDRFHELLEFDVKFAMSVVGRDNVIIVADKHTIPFLTGEDAKHGLRVPHDVIVEANLYDINIRDYAPMGKRQVKFKYSPPDMATHFSKQVDESFERFLKSNYMDVKEHSPILLEGADVCLNGKDKAIVSQKVIEKNKNVLQDWAVMIQLFNYLGRTAFIKPPRNSSVFNDNSTLRFEHLMTFIEDDMLALAELDEPDRTNLINDMKNVFRDLHILELPVFYTDETWKGYNSACGLYTNMVATDDYIYMPVYGNDPENWKRGFSTVMDKQAVELIKVNTRKTVVPVNMPHSICEMGASLKRLAWQVKGSLADKLVDMGRRRALTIEKLRKFRH